jgi:hypothetical protein
MRFNEAQEWALRNDEMRLEHQVSESVGESRTAFLPAA